MNEMNLFNKKRISSMRRLKELEQLKQTTPPEEL